MYDNAEFHILNIFLSPKFTELLLNNQKNVTRLFTLYFNDNFIKYNKYIEKGGLMDIGEFDEGDFTGRFTAFKKENFVEYFKNLWKKQFEL